MSSLTEALCISVIIALAGISAKISRVLTQCVCDHTGALDITCNAKEKCDCRPRFSGSKCEQLESGYYIPSVDIMVYRAEDAILSPPQEKKINYTLVSGSVDGRTFAVGLTLSGGLTRFEPTKLRFFVSLPKTGEYMFVLRYKTDYSWSAIKLQALLRTYFKRFSCDGMTNHTFNEPQMFVSNASAESDHLLFGSQCMLEGMYEATVEIPRDSATSSQRKIVIDSLVVLPTITYYPSYKKASPAHKQTMMKYYQAAFSIRTWAASSEIGTQALAPIYAYLYEPKACSCDPRGSRYNSCAKYGGQCDCTQNAIGRSCSICRPDYRYNTTSGIHGCHECNCNDHTDRCQFSDDKNEGVCMNCTHNTTGEKCHVCKPNYYHNSSVPINHPDACIECQCSTEGSSTSLVCDSVTGQCPCKEQVEGRRCDMCRAGFWKLDTNSAKGCEERDVCQPEKLEVKDLQSEVKLIKIILIVLAAVLAIFILLVIYLSCRIKKRRETTYNLEVKQSTNYGFETFELNLNKNVDNPYFESTPYSDLQTFTSN